MNFPRRFFRWWAIATGLLVPVSLVAGPVFSRCYWGYWLAPPGFRSEVREFTGLSTFVSLEAAGVAPEFGWVPTPLSQSEIESGAQFYRRSPIDDFWLRLHAAIDDLGLRRASDSETPEALSLVAREIGSSPLLVDGEPGYPFAKRLHGFAAVGPARAGGTLVVLALQGSEASNDHYPVFNFAYLVSGQRCQLLSQARYFEDIAGVEGFRWYAASAVAFWLGLLLQLAVVFLWGLAIVVAWLTGFAKRRAVLASGETA